MHTRLWGGDGNNTAVRVAQPPAARVKRREGHNSSDQPVIN